MLHGVVVVHAHAVQAFMQGSDSKVTRGLVLLEEHLIGRGENRRDTAIVVWGGVGVGGSGWEWSSSGVGVGWGWVGVAAAAACVMSWLPSLRACGDASRQ